ncbi:MAG: hypothetical protein GY820_28220, partial [Gammaproteobacteria bacterium]|nr:hypothetical protein [Gammaproteobacteria bacterium]
IEDGRRSDQRLFFMWRFDANKPASLERTHLNQSRSFRSSFMSINKESIDAPRRGDQERG